MAVGQSSCAKHASWLALAASETYDGRWDPLQMLLHESWTAQQQLWTCATRCVLVLQFALASPPDRGGDRDCERPAWKEAATKLRAMRAEQLAVRASCER